MQATKRFQPGITNTLLALIFVPLFVALGFWQLDRAEQKRALYREHQQRTELPPLTTLPGGVVPVEDLRYRRVALPGHVPDATRIMLDNRIVDAVAGYHLLTTFRHGGTLMLVNHGWVAAPARRDQLPRIQPDDLDNAKGMLGPPPASGIRLGDGEDAAEKLGPDLRLQRLDTQALSATLGEPLYPLVVYLEDDSASALRRDWPRPGDESDKHVAYAVQWFCFALIAAGLYVGLNRKPIKDSNAEHAS
ncbi:MAG: SURF1 family protein [Gammaproteobacteria bacterium]|nr:SURF1 family protein [Gammaproteobacteria bacterium]